MPLHQPKLKGSMSYRSQCQLLLLVFSVSWYKEVCNYTTFQTNTGKRIIRSFLEAWMLLKPIFSLNFNSFICKLVFKSSETKEHMLYAVLLRWETARGYKAKIALTCSIQAILTFSTPQSAITVMPSATVSLPTWRVLLQLPLQDLPG